MRAWWKWLSTTKRGGAWINVFTAAVTIFIAMKLPVWAGEDPNVATDLFVATYIILSVFGLAAAIEKLVRSQDADPN